MLVALKLAITVLLVYSFVAAVALRVFAPDQTLRLAAPALMSFVAALGWYFLARGRSQLTKCILTFGTWLGLTAIAAFTGGVHAPSVVGFPLIILMAAWLINMRAALTVAGLSVAATLGLMGAEAANLMPIAFPSSAVVHAGDQVVVYILSVVLAVSLVRAYQARLAELRHTGKDLMLRTVDLELTKVELNQAQAVATVGSWVYDHGVGMMRMSPETCRIFGLPLDTICGLDEFLARVHPEDQATVRQAWNAAFQGEDLDHEHRIVVAGTVHWIRQRAKWTFAPDGAMLSAVGTAQDITELRLRDAALRESEDRYRTAFQISPDAVNINRLADGLYLDVNAGFSRLAGWSKDEVVGKTARDINIWRRPADEQRLIQRILRDGVCENLEAEFVAKDGRPLTGLTSAHVMMLDGVRCVLSVTRDITQRKVAEEKIHQLAFYDPLTLLPNRRLLMNRLQQTLASTSRHHRKSALLFVDLDDFKTLNESLGHDKGDLLLQQVAKNLLTCVREGDTVSRLGGDEFVVLLEDLSENLQDAASQAEVVGGKIMTRLNQTYELLTDRHHITSSIGVTVFGGAALADIEEPVKRAELAMYQAKAAGRNTLRFFDPQMQATVTLRAALEMDLREAVLLGQFALYYQAQVSGMHELTGVESLLRWRNPRRGMVSPAEFIQLAEETGLILPLGSWILETACTQLALWAAVPTTAHLTVAVNVSARQFHQPDFVDQVLATLERTGANPQKLKLELTESMLVSNVEDVVAKMTVLKGQGVGFSLDDFGTGYSSLSYLKRLPLDQVKIDQGFVRNILIDTNDAAIAKMVVALADSMGLSVIAEGVESEAQRDFLADMGCHAYQGYFYSRPLPLAEFEAFARRG